MMGFGSDKSEMGSAWPLELRFDKKQGKLKLAYDDGFKGDIPFELLRVESPSAETRGHGGEMPPPPAGKKSVGVTSAQPVGRYAVCIEFDDGHATGLYTWPYLRELAADAKPRMKAYLDRLAEAGLSRD
tara:strand:- start:329 stop:715 length:387 start_codon:yes stop_codon:yes gene_type:complete